MLLATITDVMLSSEHQAHWSRVELWIMVTLSDFRVVQNRNVTIIASGRLKSDSQCASVNTAIAESLRSHSSGLAISSSTNSFFSLVQVRKVGIDSRARRTDASVSNLE